MPTAYDIRPDDVDFPMDATPNEILTAWRRYWQRLLTGRLVPKEEAEATLHAIEEELLARGIPVSQGD